MDPTEVVAALASARIGGHVMQVCITPGKARAGAIMRVCLIHVRATRGLIAQRNHSHWEDGMRFYAILALVCTHLTANAQQRAQAEIDTLPWHSIAVKRATKLDSASAGTFIAVDAAESRLAVLTSYGPFSTRPNVVNIYSLPQGRWQRALRLPIAEQAAMLAWSSDGTRLYVSGRTCSIISLSDGKSTTLPGGCRGLRADEESRPNRSMLWLNDSTMTARSDTCYRPDRQIQCRLIDGWTCNIFASTCESWMCSILDSSCAKDHLRSTLAGPPTLASGVMFVGAGGLFARHLESDGATEGLYAVGGGVRLLAAHEFPLSMKYLRRSASVVVGYSDGAWLNALGRDTSGVLSIGLDSADVSLGIPWSAVIAHVADGNWLNAQIMAPQLNPVSNRVVGAANGRSRGSVRCGEVRGRTLICDVVEVLSPALVGDVVGRFSLEGDHRGRGFPNLDRAAWSLISQRNVR